jgi:chromosome segregation ATPase
MSDYAEERYGPDVDTIAQQQARIIELAESGRRFIEDRKEAEQLLAAERERAEKAESMYKRSEEAYRDQEERHQRTRAEQAARQVRIEDELQAEQARAEKAEADFTELVQRNANLWDTLFTTQEQLRAEREKSARLEALAGLATSTAEEFRARGRKVYDSTPDAWTEDKALAFALNGWEWDWLQRYDALLAPEADHVGGLMSIPAYKAPEAATEPPGAAGDL